MPLQQGNKTTAGKTWQRVRWCLFLLLVLTSLAVTAAAVPQATQGQPGRPEDKRSVPSSSAALTASPAQAKASPQTALPDKSTGPQGEDVLKAAQMALSSSQQAVSLAQLCFSVLSIGVTVVTVVIAIVGLIVGFDVRRMRKDVPVLERTVTEALDKSQQLKASQDDVIKSSQDAFREIKRNSESLELLNSLYGLNDANQKKALKFLQKLAQKRHQMGINPMIQILQDPAKGPALRAEAAYGLGRYAEVKELKEYWPLILECFDQTLKAPTCPDAVLVQVLEAAGKYGVAAQDLLPSVLRRSATMDRPLIRRTCVEACEYIGVYDFDVIEWLEETINRDPVPEVRKAAEKAREALLQRKRQDPPTGDDPVP